MDDAAESIMVTTDVYRSHKRVRLEHQLRFYLVAPDITTSAMLLNWQVYSNDYNSTERDVHCFSGILMSADRHRTPCKSVERQ
jgi:hypothetical protein